MKRLPHKEFRELVPKLREKGFYKSQEGRPINWPVYNHSQINQIKEDLRFIRESVDSVRSVNTKGRVGRPQTNAKDLAKAILFCEAVGLPERQSQGWLDLLGPYLGITEQLDDRIIGEAYDRPEVLFILSQVFEMAKDS